MSSIGGGGGGGHVDILDIFWNSPSEAASSKNNEILEINVVQKFTSHALLRCQTNAKLAYEYQMTCQFDIDYVYV